MPQTVAASFDTSTALVMQSLSLDTNRLGCKSKSPSLTSTPMTHIQRSRTYQSTRISSDLTLCALLSIPASLQHHLPFQKAGPSDNLPEHLTSLHELELANESASRPTSAYKSRSRGISPYKRRRMSRSSRSLSLDHGRDTYFNTWTGSSLNENTSVLLEINAATLETGFPCLETTHRLLEEEPSVWETDPQNTTQHS